MEDMFDKTSVVKQLKEPIETALWSPIFDHTVRRFYVQDRLKLCFRLISTTYFLMGHINDDERSV